MNRKVSTLLILALLIVTLGSTVVTASPLTGPVTVHLANFRIRVNNQYIDNPASQFPLLTYNDVIYFPMTANYADALGLKVAWSSQTGLAINRDDDSVLPTKVTQDLGADNIMDSDYTATYPNFTIAINGRVIDNANEPYPILVFRDITYIPMTWTWASQEFGLETRWHPQMGFSVMSRAHDNGLSVTLTDDTFYNYRDTDVVSVGITYVWYDKVNAQLKIDPQDHSLADIPRGGNKPYSPTLYDLHPENYAYLGAALKNVGVVIGSALNPETYEAQSYQSDLENLTNWDSIKAALNLKESEIDRSKAITPLTLNVNQLPPFTINDKITINGTTNGTELYVGPDKVTINPSGDFRYDYTLPDPGKEYTVAITARGQAGNTIEKSVKIARVSVLPVTLPPTVSLPERFSPAAGDAAGKRMQDLKIIQARANGDLALNAEITRAELVTVVVRAFGQEQNAALLKGSTVFPDIANHWASGNIAMAQALIQKAGGDAIGMPDGKFNPEGKLTPAQAVSFLMKFLGLKRDPAKAWPQDYLSAAVNANLVSAADASVIAPMMNQNATRGLVFYLFDKAFATYDVGGGKTFYTKYVDTTSPELTINELPATTVNDKVAITGTASNFAELYVGTAKVTANASGEFSYDYSLPELYTEYSILIRARDLAGNTTEKTVSITRLPQQ